MQWLWELNTLPSPCMGIPLVSPHWLADEWVDIAAPHRWSPTQEWWDPGHTGCGVLQPPQCHWGHLADGLLQPLEA